MAILSQKRYPTSLLDHFSMGESKAMTTLVNPKLKLIKEEGKLLKNAILFWQFVGNIFYLTIKRQYIAYCRGYISIYE